MTTTIPFVGATAAGVANSNQMPAVVADAASFTAGMTATANIATADELIVFVAPFPCKVMAASIVPLAAVAENDTAYISAQWLRYRAGVPVGMTVKTTRTLVAGGEGMTAKTDWNFDLCNWINNTCAKGDVVTVQFTFTGAPASPGKVCAQIRYEEL